MTAQNPTLTLPKINIDAFKNNRKLVLYIVIGFSAISIISIVMEFDSEDQIKATLLYHLRRKKVIGGVHTPFETLRRGFPSHLGKDIKKIAEQLIRQGIILTKTTNYGLHVPLNKEKIGEIDTFIKKVLGYEF